MIVDFRCAVWCVECLYFCIFNPQNALGANLDLNFLFLVCVHLRAVFLSFLLAVLKLFSCKFSTSYIVLKLNELWWCNIISFFRFLPWKVCVFNANHHGMGAVCKSILTSWKHFLFVKVFVVCVSVLGRIRFTLHSLTEEVPWTQFSRDLVTIDRSDIPWTRKPNIHRIFVQDLIGVGGKLIFAYRQCSLEQMLSFLDLMFRHLSTLFGLSFHLFYILVNEIWKLKIR